MRHTTWVCLSWSWPLMWHFWNSCNFSDLEAADVSLEARVTELEENSGGSDNGKWQFCGKICTWIFLEIKKRVQTDFGSEIGHKSPLFRACAMLCCHHCPLVQGIQLEVRNECFSDLVSGSVAFFAAYPSSDTIPTGTNVLFSDVLVNDGDGYSSCSHFARTWIHIFLCSFRNPPFKESPNKLSHSITHWNKIFVCFRYDPATGIFTVPSGGDGLYYFSTYLSVASGHYAGFNIRVNGEILCTAFGDNNYNGADDYPQATCSVLTQLAEGQL